ncbi:MULTISPECIES: thioredoxin-dependent thiol peroxidase [Microbacterium]|uniref:thioredoxin-dependent thiol peroxidase n=1 Tax=Microbacterium TaxID=33882 RepID=UPI00217ED4A1|nr:MULTISPECIES: thioredoxin-dependent thiol peroxidase [Microbacterium]UWF77110.1 thioredoxin-dependent thiol peroxidase [Microbacterium neungamense]WCM55270.1 thioredoxin-dependent thiol peroxidase [Microbacterium sp. EF45047]
MATQLEPGDAAPDFSLTDAAGRTVRLGDFAGRRVILYFYPAAFTPGCTTEACDFRDNLASLRGAGYEVVGVSGDDQETLARFAAEDRLEFPLLSDPGNEVAKAYGAWGEKEIDGRTLTGVLRSTFVIDGDGRIELAQYRVDPNGHVAALREELAA